MLGVPYSRQQSGAGGENWVQMGQAMRLILVSTLQLVVDVVAGC